MAYDYYACDDVDDYDKEHKHKKKKCTEGKWKVVQVKSKTIIICLKRKKMVTVIINDINIQLLVLSRVWIFFLLSVDFSQSACSSSWFFPVFNFCSAPFLYTKAYGIWSHISISSLPPTNPSFPFKYQLPTQLHNNNNNNIPPAFVFLLWYCLFDDDGMRWDAMDWKKRIRMK